MPDPIAARNMTMHVMPRCSMLLSAMEWEGAGAKNWTDASAGGLGPSE